MKQSRYLVHTNKWKNRLEHTFTFVVADYLQDRIKGPWTTAWWDVIKDEVDGLWYIKAKVGCCWDGPSMYINLPSLRIPSLKHDIYHLMIRIGVLPDDKHTNHLIDKAFEDSVMETPSKIPFKRQHAWLMRKATNTLDQATGVMPKKIHWLEK